MTVDTANRSSGQKVNNVYINKQQALLSGYFTRIALTEINMDWDIPNVNGYNNTFTMIFYFAPGLFKSVTFELAQAFYDMAQLATGLTTEINNYIATDGDLNGLYNILITPNQEYRFFSIENLEGVAPNKKKFGIAPISQVERGTSDLCDLMGLATINSSLQFTGVATAYSTMLYTPYFDIVSKQITKKQNVKDNSTSENTGNNLLARVYLNAFGINKNKATPVVGDPEDIIGVTPFSIHYEFQNPKQIYWDTKEFLNVIDLTLIDDKGRVLYETTSMYDTTVPTEYMLGTGNTNWQLTFAVTET